MTSTGAWQSNGHSSGTSNDPALGNMTSGDQFIDNQDFANLLDLDSYDFLANYDPNGDSNGDNTHKMQDGLDLNMFVATSQQQHEGQRVNHSSQQGSNFFDMQMQMGFNQHPDAQQFGVNPNTGHGMQHHNQVVPPTPNSVEMHGDVARYLAQLDAQTRAILEQQYQLRKDHTMNFTPLGTPAVTPHGAQFNPNSQFTVPGEYFSPLVSPALEGQQHRGQASTASTASPVEFDVDMLGDAAMSQTRQTRRTRRQSATTRNAAANRKVAQSPIQKPSSKRKSGLSSVIPPKEVTELIEMHSQTRLSPTSPVSARLSRAYPSSSDSISPEPLSEGLMRPPPKPLSAKHSPAILANGRSPNIPANGQPATPASLMRLNPKDPHHDISVPNTIPEHQSADVPMLDDLILPEAAAPDAQPKSGDLLSTNGDITPRMLAQATPRLAPLHINSALSTARPTPIASSAASPVTSVVSSPIATRREAKGRLASKKRGSISGNQLVSPALRPRISPSIKPLLPEGAQLTEEQHAMLLTNRSNYQNLIEGRNIPGVTYPSDLPSQLTSKRTSHKIAEQGRRQRINVALQEMQGLLPKMSPVLGATRIEDDDDDDDDEPGSGGKKKGGKSGGNSKAATVENAIVYIKTLQTQEQIWKQERDEREKEVEELRKKLDALERRLSVSKTGESMSKEAEDATDGAQMETEAIATKSDGSLDVEVSK